MQLDRRTFLQTTAGSIAMLGCQDTEPHEAGPINGSDKKYHIIDFHQHTNYSGRSDEDLVKHQQLMGVDLSVLLPAGSRLGLAADVYGNDSAVELASHYPDSFVFYANELPDIPETKQVLEKYLKLGAKGIGEQKFPVECDSHSMQEVYAIAREFEVPVLLHFQHDTYNMGIERFHKMLEKYPTVNFIGHAQTWWGNIDKNHIQTEMYPKTSVTHGGITDQLLSNYENIYGDLSAGSGLNSMLRDEEHAIGFLERHQDRLLWASDCNDTIGAGPDCIGANSLSAIHRLVTHDATLKKILNENAVRLLQLS